MGESSPFVASQRLRLRDCFLRLREVFDDDEIAPAIIEAARLGKLRGRADRADLSYQIYDGWQGERHDDWEIEEWVWTESEVRNLDVSGMGRYWTRLFGPDAFPAADGWLEINLSGLSFEEEGLVSYFGLQKQAAAQPSRRAANRGGAPRESQKWDAVTLAIARLANAQKLDRNMECRFRNQAEMRQAILEDPDVAKFGAEDAKSGVKDETIKALVRKVFLDLLG